MTVRFPEPTQHSSAISPSSLAAALDARIASSNPDELAGGGEVTEHSCTAWLTIVL